MNVKQRTFYTSDLNNFSLEKRRCTPFVPFLSLSTYLTEMSCLNFTSFKKIRSAEALFAKRVPRAFAKRCSLPCSLLIPSDRSSRIEAILRAADSHPPCGMPGKRRRSPSVSCVKFIAAGKYRVRVILLTCYAPIVAYLCTSSESPEYHYQYREDRFRMTGDWRSIDRSIDPSSTARRGVLLGSLDSVLFVPRSKPKREEATFRVTYEVIFHDRSSRTNTHTHTHMVYV